MGFAIVIVVLASAEIRVAIAKPLFLQCVLTGFSSLCPPSFATSSEAWGGVNWENGKYPVKLYNGSSVLIYQEDRGDDNSGKLPSGGILFSSAVASSMSVVVANPITFYGNKGSAVINQSDQSGDLYNYYWTSYSRGTDGTRVNQESNTNWHNLYLDSYIPLRHKSVYDPCPYGYRIPSNGTYNQFTPNKGWKEWSFTGGVIWNQLWFAATGRRSFTGLNDYSGYAFGYFVSTSSDALNAYGIQVNNNTINKYWSYSRSHCWALRCIEECELLPDATEASAKN